MPSWRSANSSANADLPLAVGPAIRTAFLTIPSRVRDPDSMPLVATLITSPKGRRALSVELAHKAAQAVGASETDWLAEGIACDIHLPAGATAAETEAKLRGAVSGEPVDVVVQDAATRRKRVLVADMDSTMI